jgi:hypothetical protein
MRGKVKLEERGFVAASRTCACEACLGVLAAAHDPAKHLFHSKTHIYIYMCVRK